MAEQFGEKQHDATQHRRQQAREQGQVARSQDLSSALLLLAAVSALMYFGEGLAKYFVELTDRQLRGDGSGLAIEQADVVHQWLEVLYSLGLVLMPIFGTFLAVAVLANLGQVGFLFLPSKLGFDVGRISLLKGVKRLVSISSFVRLGFGIFKILVVATVAGWSLWGQRGEILGLTEMATLSIASFLFKITFSTCLKIGAALLVLAIFDYMFQRWKHEQDLKMTTQEVREEMKSLQGDPQIVARRRAIQRQLVLNRMQSAVPDADVVITNPTELAIAIKYDHETMIAPIVTAKGAGNVAEKSRRLALENNVPIVERKELARAIFQDVEIGQPIPSEQFAAMAEVLRFVYELQGRTLPGLGDAA
jgi:flagellar biosynthetic protein FlhB